MWRYFFFFGFVACVTARNLRDLNDREIVGGKPVDIQDFPFQLSLEVNGHQVCGASILNQNQAITAAHCVFPGTEEYHHLRAGTSNRETGGTLHAVEEFIPHPEYDQIPGDFDVAIIRVKDPFEYSITTQPISIRDITPAQGDLVTASGWGHLTEGGSSPIQLNAVTVPVIDAEECARNYDPFVITDRMMCAGKEGYDSCQGDSGGPLTFDGQLVGIVSWGGGCARPDKPGVYARLANLELREWIEETVDEDATRRRKEEIIAKKLKK